MGEAVINTLTNGNILTQGFLQPIETSSVPLPVKWIYFKANLVNHSALLEWGTAQELDNDHFEVQRSSDASHFSFLKKISGNGNSSQPHMYATIDPSPYNDITYYRIKQVDVNGSFSYSGIVSVKRTAENNYRLFPNPVSDVLILI